MKKFANKMWVVLAGVAALAAAAAAGAGPSESSSDVPTQVVRYDAAMLTTDDGARALYRRIAKAAEQVCPDNSYSWVLNNEVLECREHAVADAVSKIHNPRLAAAYAASSKSG